MQNQTSNTPADPRTIVLFGIPFHDVTMQETLDWIRHLIAVKTPAYLVTANLDFATQASQDIELQRILLEAELVLCDGTPLVWASKLTGKPLRERVAGSDLVPHIAACAERYGYRIFLLGGDQSSLEKAAANLQKNYPRIPSVHFYSPPFAPLHEFDNAAIEKKILAAKPDILLVAFGCPKQEKWIYMHYRKLGIPCCIGVGATVDFLAGKVSRAPSWIARIGLEWVYRLSQEPRRLFGRYTRNILFLFRQILRERKAIGAASLSLPSEPLPPLPKDIELVRWQGALTAARMDLFSPPSYKKPFIIDLSSVTSMDSRGLGVMLRVIRTAWNKDIPGCFLSPTDAVRLVIEVTRLDRVLPIAASMESALHQISLHATTTPVHAAPNQKSSILVFKLPSRITAENAESCAKAIRAEWEAKPAVLLLELDLTDTSFIDSSGLGFLLRSLRMVSQRPTATLSLQHLQPNIRNVIKVAKLESILNP